MYRRIMVMVLLAATGLGGLAGCANVRNPFQARSPQRVDDPRLPIAEQERRGRDQLPLPDSTWTSGPIDAASRLGLPAGTQN